MIRLGLCNELFEGWEFGRVCRTVKALGYDGLEIAPFTLAPRITDVSAQRRRELRAMVEDSGLETIGLHWLLAKTEGFYLTSPDAAVRLPDGRLPGRPGRGHPRPRRLADGLRLPQAARPAAGRRRAAGARRTPPRSSRPSCRASMRWASTSAWNRWRRARRTS
jgi:hypothetical protein